MRLTRRELLATGVVAGIAVANSSPRAHAAPAAQAATPVSVAVPDEDGYDLWLRYRPVVDVDLLAHYRAAAARVVRLMAGPLAQSITDELDRACTGMLDQHPTASSSVTANGTILIATPDTSPELGKTVRTNRLVAISDLDRSHPNLESRAYRCQYGLGSLQDHTL